MTAGMPQRPRSPAAEVRGERRPPADTDGGVAEGHRQQGAKELREVDLVASEAWAR